MLPIEKQEAFKDFLRRIHACPSNPGVNLTRDDEGRYIARFDPEWLVCWSVKVSPDERPKAAAELVEEAIRGSLDCDVWITSVSWAPEGKV